MKGYIISTRKYKQPNYITTDTLEGLDWTDKDTLVYHSSRDAYLTVVMQLSNLDERIKKIIYVYDGEATETNTEGSEPLLYNIFVGLDADIYADTTYLEDSATLEFLVDQYGETGLAVAMPANEIDMLTSFGTMLTKETAVNIQKLVARADWRKTYMNALRTVESALASSKESNIDMLDMFKRTSEMITLLQQDQKTTTETILQLSDQVKKAAEMATLGPQRGGFYYTTHRVPSTLSGIVMYVKVYSHCLYLDSFLRAYTHYLKNEHPQKITSKVLIAIPKLKNYTEKYSKLSQLNLDTLKYLKTQGQTADVLVTNEPVPAVLDAFFSLNARLYIVLDYMSAEPLLGGPKVHQVNAMACTADNLLYKPKGALRGGKKELTILPLLVSKNPDTIGFLPIKDYYQANQVERFSMYSKLRKEDYDKMSDFLGIGRG